MKTYIFIAAGLALAGAAYYFLSRKTKQPAQLPLAKTNERHHLTNIFSKAKEVAIGN